MISHSDLRELREQARAMLAERGHTLGRFRFERNMYGRPLMLREGRGKTARWRSTAWATARCTRCRDAGATVYRASAIGHYARVGIVGNGYRPCPADRPQERRLP